MGFLGDALVATRPPVRLLDEDPELFAGLDPARARDAGLRALAPSLQLERGAWSGEPGPAHHAPSCLGLLVVDGLLLRTVTLRGQRRSELVGPGDVIRPWQGDDEGSLVVSEARWDVLDPARVAVLDARFLAAACRWPPVLSALMGRAVRRSRWLALQLAITDLRRVEERLILLFSHMADRWGRVRPDGVLVPVRVTHDMLAQLVGAQRPTVTGALQVLARREHLRRLPDRSWLLAPQPPEELLASGDRLRAAEARATAR